MINSMIIDVYGEPDCSDNFVMSVNLVDNKAIFGLIKVPVGTWYHLAVVSTGRAGFMYVNGVVSNFNYNMFDSSKFNTTSKFNYLGRSLEGHEANAVLDEVRIYNKALSLDQIKLDMVAVGIQTSTSEICETITTSTAATRVSGFSTTGSADLPCVGNYWPIGNQSVTDVITGQGATSDSPLFVTDRFGVTDGAIQVNSNANSWQLPAGKYFQGDTTVTLWVKKFECSYNPYGK
jgi:hypothetical protein